MIFSEIRAILSDENAKEKSLHQAGYSLDAEICEDAIPRIRRGDGGGRGSGRGGGSHGKRCPAAIGRCTIDGSSWGSSRGRTV